MSLLMRHSWIFHREKLKLPVAFKLSRQLSDSQRLFVRSFASYFGREKDLYKILCVEPTASQEQIKQAFVKESSRLHPDIRGPEKTVERLGWSRKSTTEQFMEVKAAYDVLRRPEKRKAYDEERTLSHGKGGFLMEATGSRFKQNTIVDLQNARNELYTGPGNKRHENGSSGRHFIDPEEEYYKERRKNRGLAVIGGLFVSIVFINIGYIHYLQSSGSRKVV